MIFTDLELQASDRIFDLSFLQYLELDKGEIVLISDY